MIWHTGNTKHDNNGVKTLESAKLSPFVVYSMVLYEFEEGGWDIVVMADADSIHINPKSTDQRIPNLLKD